MKRFTVNIEFANGGVIKARVMAHNRNDALRRVRGTEQYADFAAGTVEKSHSIESIAIEPIDNNRFAVTNVVNKQGWYVVADLDNRIKVEWKKGRFNDTQKIVSFGDRWQDLDVMEQATAMREIADFLFFNFKELV